MRHVFSGLYLTLNPAKLALEHGCLDLKLAPASEHAWFSVLPSQKIRLMGEAISYNDQFCLRNLKEVTEYYVHVSHASTQQLSMGKRRAVNASHMATRWRAKLF